MKIKLLFLSIFLFLSLYVSRLQLFVDDYLFLYNQPSLTENFPAFFKNYTINFGFHRPIAVLYYYLIFSLYLLSPAIAHLIPLFLQVIAGYLLFQILNKQGLSTIFSLLAGLIFVTHPFASEQYMWFSANQATLANLIFILQIYIITSKLNFKKTSLFVLLLSFASILTYETTLFFFIPISFLISTKFNKPFVRTILINFIPLIFYAFTKIIVKPATPHHFADNLFSPWTNIPNLTGNLINTNFGQNYLQNFWNSYQNSGFRSILSSPVAFILLAYLITFTIFIFFIQKEKNNHTFNPKILQFWILTFLFCLPPLLVNKIFYFGFRTLFLPNITAIISLFFIFQIVLKKNMTKLIHFICLFLVFSFILINITISNKYRQLYNQDIKLAKSIAKISTPNSTIILKSKNPFSSNDTFVHADHLISCFFYEWCAPAILNGQPNSIRNIIIQHPNGSLTLPPNTTYQQLLTQRPLIFLTYKADQTLSIDNIQP
ncbi:hypothetical protein KKE45_01720 [Patescibacteria group bacterium]|nr:hypothetical protein [Patescibacteria group bacterium]